MVEFTRPSRGKAAYLLVPTFDLRPDGPIRLGQILSDPAYGKDKLRLEAVVSIPDEAISSSERRDWQSKAISHKQSNILSRWLSIILGTGEEEQDLRARNVTTLTFQPSIDYIAQSMESGKIQIYVRKRHFRASLYMVTAVKIARKLRFSTSKHTLIGLANVSSGSPTKHSVTLEIPEVVFAYSVRKIIFDREHTRYLNRTGTGLFPTYDLCELEEHRDSNTLNDDGGDDDLEKLERIDVIGLERKDVDADDLGVFSNPLIDECTGKGVAGIVTTDLSDSESSVR